jgi:multidrug resistance efflux pump
MELGHFEQQCPFHSTTRVRHRTAAIAYWAEAAEEAKFDHRSADTRRCARSERLQAAQACLRDCETADHDIRIRASTAGGVADVKFRPLSCLCNVDCFRRD